MTSVYTVTLNPAVDITYELPEFSFRQVNRVQHVCRMPGGKGINVLRVLCQLGVSATGVGFLAGPSGSWVLSELRKKNIPFRGVSVDGETRSTIAIIEDTNNGVTELIEPGPVISSDAAMKFKAEFGGMCSSGDYVVVSGSQPQGLKASFTADLIHAANLAGCYTYVDLSGETLIEAVQAKPHVVKVNEAEFRNLIGASVDAPHNKLVEAAQNLITAGSKAVVVTLGEKGSLIVTSAGVWELSAPNVTVYNTVGSGDAFLAGFVSYRVYGKTWIDSAVFATACGASNATTPVAGIVDKAQIDVLLPRVSVKQV